MEQHCFFEEKYNCSDKNDKLIECGIQRIDNIIKCSNVYCDSFLQQLKSEQSTNVDFRILAHKSCVSTYTSKTQMKRFMSKTEKQENQKLILKIQLQE